MANYFQDPVQSFVPTPVYKPDFTAIQNTLLTKQRKYDAGLSSIRSNRNSIFNAPLTKGENVEVRNQYMAEADQKLQHLAEVDLSKESNVNAANSVYDNFYKDQYIVKDMVWTKNNQAEINAGLEMRDSKDDKVRAGYWDMGMQDLYNTAERVKNSKRGDDSAMANRRYVPKRDVSEYVNKAIKDAGFKVVHVEGENTPQLRTITGGVRALTNYKTFIEGVIGNNFDDMFGVMGRVEYDGRYKKAIEAGADDATAKSVVAQQFINESTSNLSTSIKTLDDRNIELEAIIKKSSTDDGKIKPEFYKTVTAAWDQQKQIAEQKESLNNSLKNLQDPTSGDYTKIFESISNKQDEFFGNTYKSQTIGNLAVAHSAAVEEKVEANTAYQNSITNDLNERKHTLEQQKTAAEMAKAGAKASGSTGGTTSGAATSIGGSYQGLATLDPVHNKITAEKFNAEMHQQYIAGNTKIVDGLMNFLPELGLDITGSDAAMLGTVMKENYKDLKSHHTPESKKVHEKLAKYMQTKGYKITPGCPSCFLNDLKSEIYKNISENATNGIPISAEQISILTSDIDQGYSMIEDYNSKKNIVAEKVHNQIETVSKSNSEKWNLYTKVNPTTKLREFKTDEDLGNELGDISVEDGKMDVPIGISGIGPLTYGATKYKKIKGSELLSDFKNSRATIQLSGLGYRIIRKGQDDLHVTSDADVTKLRAYLNKYDDIAGMKDVKTKLMDEVVENVSTKDQNGSIHHNIGYAITAPTATQEASAGYNLVEELSNPANHTLIEEVEPKDSKYNTFLQGLKGANVDIVAGVTYSTNGKATLTFDSGKLTEAVRTTMGLSKEDVKKLISTGLTLQLSPNASGTTINQLPKPEVYQVYDKLRKGEEIKSSAMQNAYGYEYTIYPDNKGSKTTKASTLNISLKAKTWGAVPGSNPPKYGWVEDKVNSKIYRNIPLEGANGKLPDEVVEMMNQGWKQQLQRNNQLMQQYREANPTQPISLTKEEYYKTK